MTRERMTLTAAQIEMAGIIGMTPAEYATGLLEMRERELVFGVLAALRVSTLKAKHLRPGIDLKEWKKRRLEVMKRFDTLGKGDDA
jgi:hypothetical protein